MFQFLSMADVNLCCTNTIDYFLHTLPVKSKGIKKEIIIRKLQLIQEQQVTEIWAYSGFVTLNPVEI